MKTKKPLLLVAYLIFVVLEAAAAILGLTAIAFATKVPDFAIGSATDLTIKALAWAIGLTLGWLIFLQWQAGIGKKLLTAGLVAIGTLGISMIIATFAFSGQV